MAVTKRAYRTYAGLLTSERTRFLVLTRYALRQIFASRVLVVLLSVSVAPILVVAAAIYIVNNEAVRLLMGMPQPLLSINNVFFSRWLLSQAWISMMFVAIAAPIIVSPELSNGALPLFLSRPISRFDYVLGKLVAVGLLLSCVTWVPGLLLFGLQVSLAPAQWLKENYWMAGSIVLSSAICIFLFALVALAVAASVRWKIVATAFTFAAFIVPGALAEVLNNVMRTHWGSLLNVSYCVQVIFWNLFRDPTPRQLVRYQWRAIPIPAAWAMLIAICLLCVFQLHERLRAREVVRG